MMSMTEVGYNNDILDKVIQYPFHFDLEETDGNKLYYPPHIHPYIEVLYIVSGSIQILSHGKNFELVSGNLMLIDSNDVHAIFSEEGVFAKYFRFKYSPKILDASTVMCGVHYMLPCFFTQNIYTRIFSRYEINDTVIPKVIQDIMLGYCRNIYEDVNTYIPRLITIFLTIISCYSSQRSQMNNEVNPAEIDTKIMLKIFEYIYSNFKEDISPYDVAKTFNISYSHFARCFKRITNRTFNEYVNYIRIKEAEKLLITTNDEITQIAFQCGFSDTSYFIKQFKSLMNTTPRQFRKKAKESLNEFINFMKPEILNINTKYTLLDAYKFS